MGTATSPCQGGPWPPLRVPPSTHLARGAEGLREELDEGLVVVGGQHPVLHQPHRQPQGTQLPPATTRRGSARSRTHCSPSPVVGPPLGTATPGSCSCRVPGPAACTHPWSLAVLGKGRSWNQPLVGSVKMVSRGNSTWGDQRQGMNGVGAHVRAPRAAPQHSSSPQGSRCDTAQGSVGARGSSWVLTRGHLAAEHGEGLRVWRCPQSSPAPRSHSCLRCPSPTPPRSTRRPPTRPPAARTPAPRPSAGNGFS